MKFTGERFIPDEELISDEIGYEHLHRYYAAAALVNGKSVLDIACGEGYGTNILAAYAGFVAGVDIDKESIASANLKYAPNYKNLQFKWGAADAIPYADKTFDIVVAFETIEHLNPETQYAFLREIKRVLRQEGVLVMSTPDKKNYSDRYGHTNEFHLREFYKSEFLNFLEPYFTHVSLFDQGYEIVGIISNNETEKAKKINLHNWNNSNNGAALNRKYIIAIASDVVIPSSFNEFASVVPKVDKDFFATMDRLVTMNREIEELGKWGRGMEKDINEATAKTNNLHKTILQQLETIAASNSKILALTDESKKYQATAESFRNKNEYLQQEKDILLQELAETKASALMELNAARALNINLQQEKESFQKKIDEKDMLLQELRQQKHQLFQESEMTRMRLSEIYDSDGWRLLLKYYKIKGKLLPEHTKRYKSLKRVFNSFHTFKNKIGRSKNDKPDFVPVQNKAFIPAAAPKYESLTLPVFEYPQVSIIILAYNGWEMNYQCIQSIIANTQGVSYQVLLADDCSSDATKDCTGIIKNLIHCRNEKNLGFLANCNHAAATVSSKYILFLNNDTTVKPHWLSSLVTLSESDPAIGMVGSKLIYPDGRLQEAGGIIWNDASGWNYGHKQDPTLPQFNYVKEVDYISGACILIRKTTWDKAGGFDERYTPAYCEDSDFAFVLRKMGYKVVYQPMSEVVHFEGYSHGTDDSLQQATSTKAYQKINNEKFYLKWKDVLSKEQFPNAVNVFNARDRSAHKKTILVIDHYVPHYDQDAGSKTVFSYLKVFELLKLNIKFIGDNFFKHEPYTTVLQQMGIEVLYGNWYSENWRIWIKENADKIDYVYINRPHIAIKYIDFIRENTKAKILYYGHDLHFIREQKQYELLKDDNLLASAAKWKKTEQYLFDKSDVILAPSETESGIIRSLNPAFSVETILPYFFKDPAQAIEKFENRKEILFVGGFSHTPNLDAVLWFCDKVWPLVIKALPSVTFTVVGSKPPEAIMQLQCDSIDVKGFVSEEELYAIYAKSRIVVIPLRYGAGVKGKTVEAMYNGIPIVSTSFGIEGIPGSYIAKHNAFDGAEGFAAEVVRLYKDEAALKEASRGETTDINEFFTQQAAIEKMKKILNLQS
jgi:O-antigen biosynthesis protein